MSGEWWSWTVPGFLVACSIVKVVIGVVLLCVFSACVVQLL